MSANGYETEGWLGSLDAEVQVPDLARNAAYSVAQFHRLVRKSLSGSPMAIRRRLLLERAAYELTRTGKSITEIAFDAAFGSLEGFGRAFRRAFHLSPSEFRRLAPSDYRLGSDARLHFAPAEVSGKGANPMHTAELMIEHHVWHMGQILDRVETWSDADLDRDMRALEMHDWHECRVTFRQMLGRAAAFAAPWMHSINGIESPYFPETVAQMREALVRGRIGFVEIIRSVERDRSWDLTFVDTVCEPPVVFSYGGVIAHVLTHTTYRRGALVSELRAMGIHDLRFSDPLAGGWRLVEEDAAN